MKFRCDCGTVIRDQTDFLPFKARFIADRDLDDLTEALDVTLERLATQVWQAAVDGADLRQVQKLAGSREMQLAMRRALYHYAERAMYQCPACSRLYLDTVSAGTTTFLPVDPNTATALLDSIEGERWKRPIVGIWDTEFAQRHKVLPGQLRQGDFVVLPQVGVTQGTESFDTWEELEARYHEVVAQAQADGVLRSALLRKDANLVHIWPSGDPAANESPHYSIEIEAEVWAPGDWNPTDANTNVRVIFADDSRWVATFFTYANIGSLTEKNKRTGECDGGRYFWASDMILVDEVSQQRIEEIVAHLIATENFESVFSPL